MIKAYLFLIVGLLSSVVSFASALSLDLNCAGGRASLELPNGVSLLATSFRGSAQNPEPGRFLWDVKTSYGNFARVTYSGQTLNFAFRLYTDTRPGSSYALESATENPGDLLNFYDQVSKTGGRFTLFAESEYSDTITPIDDLFRVRFSNGNAIILEAGDNSLVLCEILKLGVPSGQGPVRCENRPAIRLRSGLYRTVSQDTGKGECDARVDASSPSELYINGPGSTNGMSDSGCKPRAIQKYRAKGNHYYYESPDASTTTRLTVINETSFEEYISISVPGRTTVFRLKSTWIN